MFEKVSVLVPTRGRLVPLRKMVESFKATTDDLGDAELIFRADDDDKETIKLLVQLSDVTGAVLVGPHVDGYRSMPLFFNDMLAISTGDVLMIGNDDMVFRTPGWPAKVLEAANRHQDGLFDIGVTTHNETHYPFAIVSRKATDRMGFLWDPRLFWGDIFLRDVMAHFGRCEMLPEVRVDHEWAGHPYDVLHIDPNYWTDTHPTAVREAISKLEGL